MKKQKRTLSDLVREYIQTSVVDGRLKPGERLREVDIAQALNMSRSPIREALKTLENEGLVQPASGKGMVVSKLSRVEILELFLYREVLEGLASELAAASITDEELEKLDELIAVAEQLADFSPAALVANNREFHQLIYIVTRNEYLIDSVGQLRKFLSLLPGTNYAKPERRAVIVQEHKDIVSALRRHDPAAAKEASRVHVRNSAFAQLSFILDVDLS